MHSWEQVLEGILELDEDIKSLVERVGHEIGDGGGDLDRF